MIKAGKPKNWHQNCFGELYKDLTNCQLFSAEEEKELFAKSKKGDIEARNLLIRSQLQWVLKMAIKRAGKDQTLAHDLFTDAGVNAVLTGVKKFNPAKNRRLITYVSTIARNNFIVYMRIYKAKVISLPVNGPRSSKSELSPEMQEDARRATNVDSIHVVYNTDGPDSLDSIEYGIEIEDKPKENRFSYDADEFWKIIASPIFGLTKHELDVIHQRCVSNYAEVPKNMSENERKKKTRFARQVQLSGLEKIKNVLKNVFSYEEIVNVLDFIHEVKLLQKAS
jgi:DNA-directed RNA polymerase specialized sigma subunit